MKILNSIPTFVNHTCQYVYENISCLLYIVEIVPEQAIYFTSYFALVKDIAEAYGSWVALIIVIMSIVLTMVSIQQLVSYTTEYIKPTNKPNKSINNFSLDKFFCRHNLSKFFNK